MQLYRRSYGGGTPYERTIENPTISTGKSYRACYSFSKFGHGTRRNPDFDVYIKWEDVEALIESFAKNGFAKAIKMKADLAAFEHIRVALAPPIENILPKTKPLNILADMVRKHESA